MDAANPRYGTPGFHRQRRSGPHDRAHLPDFDERMERVIAAMAEEAAAARTDIERFYSFVMREETTYRPIQILDFQRVFFDFVLAHPRSMVRGFAGCTKTYMVSALALFETGQDPTERGVIASATQLQSRKPMGMVRRYIEESAELQLVFPELMPSRRRGDPWTQSALTVQRQGFIRDATIAAVHEGAKLPGARLSWFNADDLLTLDNTTSETQRDYTWDWLFSTVMPRLDADNARFLVTNTPFFPTDLTYQLEQGRDGTKPMPSLTFDAEGDIIIRNTNWDSPLIRPAHTKDPEGVRHRLVSHDSPVYAQMVGIDTQDPTWVDEHDKVPLWPERWGWPQLNELKESMTTIDYNRTKKCIVTDPAKQRVKQEHIDLCKAMAARQGAFYTVSQWQGDDAFTGTDPAFGLNPKNDQSCIFTFALLPNGFRRILEIQIDRWGSDELTDRIVDAAKRFQSIVCVEGNGAQRIVRDWAMKKSVDVLVRARDTTHKNKTDPRFGVEQFMMEVQQGLWLLPHDPRTGRITDPGIQAFVKGCFDYRPGQHTPDVIMAGWIAREQARRIGVLEMAPQGMMPLSSIGAR